MNKARLLLTVLFFLMTACLNFKGSDNSTQMPGRADRSYLRWLEKQAMYNAAPSLLAEVSQSERLWANYPVENHAMILLNAAPTWLAVTPDISRAGQPLFSFIVPWLPRLAGVSINGIYCGPLLEGPDLWSKGDNAQSGIVSLGFDPKAGDSRTFQAFIQSAENAGFQTGSDLPGAATGTGPDFILQIHNAPGSKGIYAMLEMSAQAATKTGADFKDRTAAPISTLEALREDGIIPQKMANEQFDWLPENGWAITENAVGLDGNARRWLYRYFGSPERPVLMWTDPFGQAKRILAAAIIQHTGLQGQTLAGLSILPLLGLTPESASGASKSVVYNAWLSVLDDLSSQIHRYGGWSLQTDAVPASLISRILKGDCDFCRDDVSELLALVSLYEKDGRPLATLFSRWLEEKLDLSRLAHGYYATGERMLLVVEDKKTREKLLKLSTGQKMSTLKNMISAAGPDVGQAASFLLRFRASLPGLAFFEPEELGFFNNTEASAGQDDLRKAMDLRNLLQARKEYNLANGRLEKVYLFDKSAIGLLFALENGAYWFTAMNFGSNAISNSAKLPISPIEVIDVANHGQKQKSSLTGTTYQFDLGGYECLSMVLLTGSIQNQG